MTSDTRQDLLRIFERHRSTPGAAFEEDHFIDFLLPQPKKNRAVYDSFLGLRRYNAFVDELQLHFGIYLSMSDYDANYSLDKFVERILAIQASPKSSLTSYRNAKKAGFGWGAIAMGNIVVLVLALFLWRYSLVAASGFLLCAFVADFAVLRWHFRWRNYQRKILKSIQSAGDP